MSIALNASRFTENLTQVKFSAPVNAMVGWLTSVQGSDLTYHRVRQEKWSEFTKITAYAKPSYDITITPKQYSAIKQVLTARDVLQVPQEAMLLFDVVLQELWAQTDSSLVTPPTGNAPQFQLPPTLPVATIQEAEKALSDLDGQEAQLRQEIARRRTALEQQYSAQKQALKTKATT